MSTTKIIKEDLDVDLKAIVQQVEDSKGAAATLPARLTQMEISIQGTGGDVTLLQENVQDLQATVGMISEEGNLNEVYEYDANGNVTKQTVTGDVAFVLNYVYADAVAGTLNYSEKTYTKDAQTVKVKKTYTYDGATGNITGIQTVTTITP